MSVLYKLNEVQEVRRSKYSEALRKSPVESLLVPEAVQPAQRIVPETQPQPLKSQTWMFKSIVVLLVLLILAVGMMIGILLRSPSSEKKAIKPAVKAAQAVKSEVRSKTVPKTTPKATTAKPLRQKVSK